jgi:hypothetical protein
MIVRHRSDGVVEIQRRGAWRALAASPPAVVLAWVLLFLVAVTGLAAVLVEAPKLTLLAGLAGLGLLLARGPARDAVPAMTGRAGRPVP